jgi:AmiR/NasT family two-component response regulator
MVCSPAVRYGEVPSHGVNVPITVLIADDSALIRQTICRTLQDDSDIQIVGEAVDFASAVGLTWELKPQILILDLHMPDQDALAPMSFRSQLTHNCQIIAISFSSDEETTALARSIEASILLEKMRLATDLVPAIKKIISTDTPKTAKADLHDIKRCAAGCCFFIGTKAVAEDDYKIAMFDVIPGPDVKMTQTTVPCMKFVPNKRRADKAGFYLGWTALDFEPTGDYFIYDAETNEFVRNATAEDVKRWESFRA